MLKSERAFNSLQFDGCEKADAELYHQKFECKDQKARSDFAAMRAEHSLDGLFIRDLVREG